jgi:hypothetical protein
MKIKYLLLLTILAAAVVISCNKTTTLPVSNPTPTDIFTATSLSHTKDSVNVGDTVYLNVAGTVYDTTKAIYAWLTSTDTVSGTIDVYNSGSAASPITVKRKIGAQSNGLYTWSATIPLVGATYVPAKTVLTITASFQYQLSLSTQLPSSLTLKDAGVKKKTVFVK